MKHYYNRRKFVKLSAAAVAGTSAILSGIPWACAPGSDITVWEVPGGEALCSPDYEVTLKSRGVTFKPFTYFTYRKGVDKIIDWDGDGKYVKLHFGAVNSVKFDELEDIKDTYAHSWTCFDFSKGPVEVEVKILRPFQGLTTPIKSCGIYPSDLDIQCQVIGDNVVRFTVDKPSKFALIPNHLEAHEKLNGMTSKEVLEGYRNPLLIFARHPETDVPSKTAEGTLVIKPGDKYDVEHFQNARTIYFEKGIHDYSKYNPADITHRIGLKKGQSVYLEGGSYVYGVFISDEKFIGDMPLIYGRGTFSGDKQVWTTKQKVAERVNVIGVQVTDPHNHLGVWGIVRDVAAVGGWHGNTDGINAWRPEDDDPYEGWHVEDCFCMACDTNLFLGGNARVRNHTVWQNNNAEPLWVRHNWGSVLDGLYVIAYNRFKGGGQTINFAMDNRRPEMFGNVVTVKNVVVDAPFIPSLFIVTSALDRKEIIYEDVLFENIIVKTPHIRDKSRVGLLDKKHSNFGKVVFRNVVINGVKVTAENYTDYFDLLNNVSIGKEVFFE
jgi:hypothetical protein